MIKSEKGFTLLESLFVLSVFLVVASITAIMIKPQYSFLEKQLFFSQLKSDLLYAQQYAISHQTEISVHFIPEENRYFAKERLNLNPIMSREYPKEYEIKGESMKLFFKFLPDGNVNQFGSFNISIRKEKYRLTFLIGKGRFYVAKE